MAVPGITYRVVGGEPLTHQQMNDNFRSLIYSSSIVDGGDTLRLHFDTETSSDYHQIPLNSGTGGLSIIGNVNNRLVTATGTALEGETNLTFDGTQLALTGNASINDGDDNLLIGQGAGGSVTTGENTVVGILAGTNLTGLANTTLGYQALDNAAASNNSVAIGHSSLGILASGHDNTAIGESAGATLTTGQGNIYIGNNAGPATNTAQSNKLYINNQASDTPLILGDFSTNTVTFNSTVSASVFSGSFVGDGTNLTGLTVTQEWDGTHNGDAEITGSLTVSGSNAVVDFTDVQSISGSVFSGSFVGDGSGLTGITAAVEWDGTRDGNAEITGSFIVSGSTPTIDLQGVTTIDDNIKIHNFNSTTIGIGFRTLHLANAAVSDAVVIGNNAACLATGNNIVTVGRSAGVCTGDFSTLVGSRAGESNSGCYNAAVGYETLGGTGNGQFNTAIGARSQCQVTSGRYNTAIGYQSLRGTTTGYNNTAIGTSTLYSLNGTDGTNTAIGAYAGYRVQGSCNVLIGYYAGPTVLPTTVNSKLYINNQASDTPLIYGDFVTGQVTINSQVSASIFSGSFVGDGSQLTGVSGGIYEAGSGTAAIQPIQSGTASGNYSVVAGGNNNTAAGVNSAVGGGTNNVVGSTTATIVGGTSNRLAGNCSTIAGGKLNTGSADFAFIGGGQLNHIESGQTYSSILAGSENKIIGSGGDSNTILGGFSNIASGSSNSVIGGSANNITGNIQAYVFGSNITADISTSIGSTNFYTNNIHVTGSTTANGILKLSRRETTPSPAQEGMIIASGSAGASKLYYYDGSSWNALF